MRLFCVMLGIIFLSAGCCEIPIRDCCKPPVQELTQDISPVTFKVKGLKSEDCEEVDCNKGEEGRVSERASELDSDGDGVPDYIDQCPGTPKGVQVDGRGCPLDSDGDGVPDNVDQCPGTPNGAKVDSRGCWVIAYPLFGFDKYNIKPQYYHAIDEVALILRKNSSLKISIYGYADYIGTDAYNLSLSQRRADTVKNYLEGKGIERGRLSAVGYGEAKPKASTSPGRALNRRVEFHPVQ